MKPALGFWNATTLQGYIKQLVWWLENIHKWTKDHIICLPYMTRAFLHICIILVKPSPLPQTFMTSSPQFGNTHKQIWNWNLFPRQKNIQKTEMICYVWPVNSVSLDNGLGPDDGEGLTEPLVQAMDSWMHSSECNMKRVTE